MITAGEVLKKKRESLGKNLDVVSLDTKIQKRFLIYIEKNEFDRFESEIFLTGFIKIYSDYLNLDTHKVLALYRRSNPFGILKSDEPKKNKKKLKISNLLTPKILITTLLTFFLVGIFAYIGIQIYKFQSPPELEISQPLNESSIEEENIVVKGSTLNTAVLEINEKPVKVNNDGTFEYSIKLNPGINTITIRAQKNSNNILETVETLKVTYNKPQENNKKEETEENKANIITLEVVDSSAWIKLDIDNENKVSKIVQPSKENFEIKEKLYITTGRISNTFIYFNEELLPWPSSATSGVVEMTCTLKDQTISCN